MLLHTVYHYVYDVSRSTPNITCDGGENFSQAPLNRGVMCTKASF